jgi:hypothetical protein
MTIVCDEDGKFQIQHWPPLPIDDSVAILQILKVSITDYDMKIINIYLLETNIYHGRNIKSNDFCSLSTSI